MPLHGNDEYLESKVTGSNNNSNYIRARDLLGATTTTQRSPSTNAGANGDSGGSADNSQTTSTASLPSNHVIPVNTKCGLWLL